jgi:hypothetical protein
MDVPGTPGTSISWVRAALVEFGFGELDISLTDLTAPGKVIQLGYEPNRIDLMTSKGDGNYAGTVFHSVTPQPLRIKSWHGQNTNPAQSGGQSGERCETALATK